MPSQTEHETSLKRTLYTHNHPKKDTYTFTRDRHTYAETLETKNQDQKTQKKIAKFVPYNKNSIYNKDCLARKH